ncbi:heme exporter protein CcmB [Biformimicrobium ophioploci]|uniref:Heme exporter protein B n=2 Tax=Biformimicrobium ophioploci TaxID=3036711 RepID=A0ABQ6M005_9GAMM|nr:heme exporter protein CcmB [Microbulbifer sp. NKW57]
MSTEVRPDTFAMVEGPGFLRILRRELLLAYRQRGDLANPLLFFLMVLALVPLGVGPAPDMLAALAPGMIWIVALLANLLAQDGLFRGDFADGSLEQLALSPQPLYFGVLAKVLVHWLVTGLPLTLFAPVLGLMLSLPESGYLPLLLSMLLGTASLSLLGAIGAGLTVSLHRPGLLLPLIVMPLYAPVLIFGTGAVQAAIEGFAYGGQLAVLGAMLAAALALAPLAVAGALRISLSD